MIRNPGSEGPEPGGKEIPMNREAVNFERKFALFESICEPRIIARMNDVDFKLVKFEGDFVWHRHDDTDEAFIVLDGEMTIALRDGDVNLGPGEMYVVEKGVEHKPVSEGGCRILLVEPANTVNTGDRESDLTAPGEIWI